MRISTSYNNFSRAKLDHDLIGRFDLPIYNTGADIFTNFMSNFKGNAIYRTGTELATIFQDCAIYEFKFSQNQSYLLLFYDDSGTVKIKFLTYDSNGDLVFVQNGGSDLTVSTPYTLEHAKQLQLAQNADVMYICHKQYIPKTLTRTSAISFTLANAVFTGAGFDSPSGGTVGYPAACCFYNGRLYYGGATLKTTTIWGSAVGTYTNCTIPATILDDSPLKLTVAQLTELS